MDAGGNLLGQRTHRAAVAVIEDENFAHGLLPFEGRELYPRAAEGPLQAAPDAAQIG